jgi:hypothetical protein
MSRMAGDYGYDLDTPIDYESAAKKKSRIGIDDVQNAASIAGMLPVVGTFADLGNAALYAARGKFGEAAFSALSAIPGVGDLFGGARMAGKAAKAAM